MNRPDPGVFSRLTTHPRHLAARVRYEVWQWLRTVLPLHVKTWAKRSILRRPQEGWGRLVHQDQHSLAAMSFDPAAAAVLPRPDRAPRQPKHDLIVFAATDWHAGFQRPQQLARLFADDGHRVFYISPSLGDTSAPGTATSPVMTTIRPRVYEIHLHKPPALDVNPAHRQSDALATWMNVFERLQQEQGIVDAVLVVHLPLWGPLATRLRERFSWKLVYDPLGLHGGFAPNDPPTRGDETAVAAESDLVVVASPALYAELQVRNPQFICVPNGADQAAESHSWERCYLQLAEAIRHLYPQASIIVPTHNNLHLTRICLDSVFRNTSWPNWEVIVIDNASTDGAPGYLRELEARHDNVRCIFNERNEGFARAINHGIAAAGGEYLVLLNNDTIVTRGWLTTMLRYVDAHGDVGMVGPATNLAGNEARIDVDYASIEEMEAFAERYTREHADEAMALNMLGFFCAVIPRRVFDEVGPLDERFGIGMFEDDDLSLRVRRAGYRLVCIDGAFVHHFHSATWRRFSQKEYLHLFETNRAKFEEKWGIRWKPHRYRWRRPQQPAPR